MVKNSLVNELKKLLIKPTTYDFKAHFNRNLAESILLMSIFRSISEMNKVNSFDILENKEVIILCESAAYNIKVKDNNLQYFENDILKLEGADNKETLKEILKIVK